MTRHSADRLELNALIVKVFLAVMVCWFAIQPLRAAEPTLDKTGTQWAPYLEWTLPNPSFSGNPFDLKAAVTFRHNDGKAGHTTEMFYAGNNQWKFRFTATRPGKWTFVSTSDDRDLDGRRGTVSVKANPDSFGFVTHVGNKWARHRGVAGEPEAFVPQFVMYGHPRTFHDKPDKIEKDIRVFLGEHGFNGFHVPVFCRWFDLEHDRASEISSKDPNPDFRTFEALELLITKVHAAGGVVHLWAWGDQMRTQTPVKWKINGKVDKRLQRYIAARLGPLPGWTMGYGFDLWEWVKGEQLTEWHGHMHAHFGWPHLLGARSGKNEFQQLSENLDYASFEQHRPSYETYVKSITRRTGKPAFSEDRFRIRQSEQYKFKDYSMEMVRRGLWHSTMAGGVANIWGNLQGQLAINMGGGLSLPFPEKEAIKTYSLFFRNRFFADVQRSNSLTDGVCLKRPDDSLLVFYREDCNSLRIDLSKLPGSLPGVAVDTRKPYAEIDMGQLAAASQVWKAPYRTDWAIAVGTGRPSRSSRSGRK